MSIAFSKRVSKNFLDKVESICRELDINPSWLMACIAFETGETFKPDIKNKYSGAIGLIQFMPDTAKSLGTTIESLALMPPETQLNYVLKYFMPYKGKLKGLEDTYMAILFPVAIGKPLNFVLFDKNDTVHKKRYPQNSGLDYNKDGQITKLEASIAVQKKLAIGLKPENCI